MRRGIHLRDLSDMPHKSTFARHVLPTGHSYTKRNTSPLPLRRGKYIYEIGRTVQCVSWRIALRNMSLRFIMLFLTNHPSPVMSSPLATIIQKGASSSSFKSRILDRLEETKIMKDKILTGDSEFLKDRKYLLFGSHVT